MSTEKERGGCRYSLCKQRWEVKKESMKKAARGEDWQGHGLQSEGKKGSGPSLGPPGDRLHSAEVRSHVCLLCFSSLTEIVILTDPVSVCERWPSKWLIGYSLTISS